MEETTTTTSDEKSATPWTMHAQFPFALVPNTAYKIIPYQLPREPVCRLLTDAEQQLLQEPPKRYTYEEWDRRVTELKRAILPSTPTTSREDQGEEQF